MLTLVMFSAHPEKYEHELAIALRSVLDKNEYDDEKIAAMLTEKMLVFSLCFLFFCFSPRSHKGAGWFGSSHPVSGCSGHPDFLQAWHPFFRSLLFIFSPNSLLLGFYLRKIELATHWPLVLLLSLSWPRPELCGPAPCPGLVLVLAAPLNSVARLCVRACSSQTAGGFRKVFLHWFPPTLEFSELMPTPKKC